MANHFFTSESVTEGHPDKLCDQIADAVLDEIIAKDPQAHVACEVTATTGVIHVMGEISTECYVDIASIAREVVKDIGYDDPACGFDGNTCGVITSIDIQSPDIAMGVNESLEAKNGATDANDLIGAGDQGMMFGYACDETPELMPLAISLAHKLSKRLSQVRKDGTLSYLRPDGKTQVTVEYDGDQPVRVDTVVVSTQHNPDVTLEQIRKDIIATVIQAVIPARWLDEKTKFYVNPTGRFVIGGPVGIVDLPAEKLSLILMAATAGMGAALFRVRIRLKLTVPRLMRHAMRQKILLLPVWQKNVSSNLLMRLALHARFLLWWKPLAPRLTAMRSCLLPFPRCLICGRQQSSVTLIFVGPFTVPSPTMAIWDERT